MIGTRPGPLAELRPSDPRDERPSHTRSIGIVPARGARVIATGRRG